MQIEGYSARRTVLARGGRVGDCIMRFRARITVISSPRRPLLIIIVHAQSMGHRTRGKRVTAGMRNRNNRGAGLLANRGGTR